MAPRPPKGTPPKGPQPVISFRISSEIQALIAEIRALEPHAEPGLIPVTVGSDSEFARWLFVEAAEKLRNRLAARLKLKDLIIEDKKISDKMEYISHLSRSGKISHQDMVDSIEELEEQKIDNYREIEKICKENTINPPDGYTWEEDDTPFTYKERTFNEDLYMVHELNSYLFYEDGRKSLSTKRKNKIKDFCSRFGWKLDTTEDEIGILKDLMDDNHPIWGIIQFSESEQNYKKATWINPIKNRLKVLSNK